MTHNPSSINHGTKNHGKIVVANGQEINIKKSSTWFLSCSNQDSYLNMKAMLLAPKIPKNLIGVAKLTSDNNITVEFDLIGYAMKEKMTGQILLEGVRKQGVYRLIEEKRCCSSQKKETSVKQQWHRGFGHRFKKNCVKL